MAGKKNTEINGQHYFRITRTVGHKIVDGRKQPIKKQFYGTSKGDAEKKYKEYLEEQAKIKLQGESNDDYATLNSCSNEYIDLVLSVSGKFAQGTKDLYIRNYRKHIEGSWLDKMCMKDITCDMIQRYYNDLDVTRDALANTHKFMSNFYKWYSKTRHRENVLLAVELPAKRKVEVKPEIVVWTDSELDAVLSHSEGHRQKLLMFMLNYTGLRISEALDLKYADIRDGVIHMTSQLYNGEHVPPKYNSKRDIPLHPKLERELAIHKAWHEEEMIKNGYTTEYIFTTDKGTQYDRTNLRKTMNRYYKQIGVPAKGFHVYRATFCTNLCKAGVSLEVASKLLGHKSLEITAAHYALVSPDTKRSAIEMLS